MFLPLLGSTAFLALAIWARNAPLSLCKCHKIYLKNSGSEHRLQMPNASNQSQSDWGRGSRIPSISHSSPSRKQRSVETPHLWMKHSASPVGWGLPWAVLDRGLPLCAQGGLHTERWQSQGQAREPPPIPSIHVSMRLWVRVDSERLRKQMSSHREMSGWPPVRDQQRTRLPHSTSADGYWPPFRTRFCYYPVH